MSRLEEIKEFAEHLALSEQDLYWLIQQAERVEELEEQLQASFFTMVEVDNMKVKLERYKQALEEIAYADWEMSHYEYSLLVSRISRQALKVDKDD